MRTIRQSMIMVSVGILFAIFHSFFIVIFTSTEYRPNSEVAFDQLSGEDFYSYMQKTFFTFRDDPYEQPPASEQPMAARVNEEREYERTEDSTDATEIVDDDSEDYDEEEEEENDEENLNDGMVEVKLEEMETDCSSTRESVDHHSAEISGGGKLSDFYVYFSIDIFLFSRISTKY